VGRRASVIVSDPWDYAKLGEHVEAWGFRLMQDEGKFCDRASVAQRWFEEEFGPVVGMLRQAGLIGDRTDAEAYMWVAAERYRLIRTHRWDEILASPSLSADLHAAARWFEDRYTVSPEWPDECYVNHSFEPTGLWHLGFIFAARDLVQGDEITVDYRHLLAPGQEESFNDAASGEKITGLSWQESLARSTRALAALLG